MKKIFPAVIALMAAAIAMQAQPTVVLKKVMELKMPKTVDDEMPGTRGGSVVWHPVFKKYYAAFAGNAEYPMAVFDVKGNRISSDDQTAMIDTRGLWYNPASKLVSGNAFDVNGWFTYTLDSKGLPSDISITKEGMNQPDAQRVGTYCPPARQTLFLFGSQVYMYSEDAMPVDSLLIHWGRTKTDGPADGEDILTEHEDYNHSTVIYTGIKGQELGFLNITNKQVELYDMKTGFQSKVLSLPETAIAEVMFNFAYTNGIYWLFNMELRKWVGYK